MASRLTRADRLLLWTTVPLMVVVFAAHLEETARTGLAQLPVFAKWNPGAYPQVGGFRLETDSSDSGLQVGDRLVRLGDRDLEDVGYIGFQAIGLARTTPGHPVTLVFERDGERHRVPLEARAHPHRWARVPTLVLIPLVCVLLLLRAPGQPDVHRFYLCFMIYAIGQAQFYGGAEWKSWLAAAVWNVTSVAMLYAMLRFTRHFPPEMPDRRRVPAWLPWVCAALYIVFVRANYVLAWPLPIEWVPRVSYAFHGGMSVLGIGVLAWNYLHAWPAGRRRLRWILLGTALGSLPVIAAGLAPWLLPEWGGFRMTFAMGFLTSAIWMMGAVLGTVRDNAFDVDRLIGATAVWSIAAGAAVAGLVVVAPLVATGFSQTLGLDPTMTRVAVAALLGALVIPLGVRLRPHVDGLLFPRRAAVKKGAARLVDDLGGFENPPTLLRHAVEQTALLFDARGFALYVRDDDSLHRRQARMLELPEHLDAETYDSMPNEVRSQNMSDAFSPYLTSAVALLIPIRPSGDLDALLALGPKRSGDIYTHDDTAVVGTIAACVEKNWLQIQKRAADHANREKTNLLTAASHDLRQPLHAVSLLAETLQDKLEDPELRSLLAQIGDSTHDLDEMLTGLLDRAKLDADSVHTDVGHVALADVFAQLSRDFELPAQESGIRLRIRPTGMAVRSDRILLARILRNLASNAVRYAGSGRSVLICARRRGREVAIEVRDSGPGIPLDRQTEIFEAFRQLEGRRAHGGLGLGLSIVDGLASILGHRVELRSAPGRGSIFRVLAEASTATNLVPSDAIGYVTPEVPVVAPRRVLVLDDDVRVREASAAILEQWGCETRAVADLEEARVALADDWRPDVLLADYDLGRGRTGLDAITALGDALGDRIRIAILTADADPSTLARIRAAGFSMLRKPVRPAKLRALLATF